MSEPTTPDRTPDLTTPAATGVQADRTAAASSAASATTASAASRSTTAPAAQERTPLWQVTSRTVVFGAIGAALYGALGVFSFIIPGTGNVAIRPAIALIPFIGLRFGPIAGFFTGFVGNAIIDQIQGYGFLTYWNWSLANGLIGLAAGILAYLWREPAGTGAQVGRTIAISLLAVPIGLLFTVTDLFLGSTVEAWFITAYIPAVITTAIAAGVLTIALDRVWKPLQNLAGR